MSKNLGIQAKELSIVINGKMKFYLQIKSI